MMRMATAKSILPYQKRKGYESDIELWGTAEPHYKRWPAAKMPTRQDSQMIVCLRSKPLQTGPRLSLEPKRTLAGSGGHPAASRYIVATWTPKVCAILSAHGRERVKQGRNRSLETLEERRSIHYSAANPPKSCEAKKPKTL
jgi:hypothetical protein